ncbi:hypothetical protein R75465_06325 [Paraburkholderia aspalathi]|nr:hypothetical protein R75465_06325 [Paraburkholderia aspalathi]
MPRFLRLWLYDRAFVTRYSGFWRASPCFSLALDDIIRTAFMMLCFYTTRANFAIPPSEQSRAIASRDLHSKHLSSIVFIESGLEPLVLYADLVGFVSAQ